MDPFLKYCSSKRKFESWQWNERFVQGCRSGGHDRSNIALGIGIGLVQQVDGPPVLLIPTTERNLFASTRAAQPLAGQHRVDDRWAPVYSSVRWPPSRSPLRILRSCLRRCPIRPSFLSRSWSKYSYTSPIRISSRRNRYRELS